jgi:hypothetical protein
MRARYDAPTVRTPVALFIFNRPDLTSRVFNAIAEAQPTRLFVIADGARPDHPDDQALVQATRAVAQRVDWPCDVELCFAEANLGCGNRFYTGLDWVFRHADRAIILEDDCLPDLTFFRYCDELLGRYREDERVHMVNGFSPFGSRSSSDFSYRFSRCFHIWGWGTWARAWRHYDYTMRAWPALRRTRWLENHLRNRRAAQIARLLFDATYEAPMRQWDFQWAFAGWLRNAVAAVPTINLVENLGHGATGTHMRDPNHPLAGLSAESMVFPLRHPPRVDVDEAADRAVWRLTANRYPRYRSGPIRRALGKPAPV